MSKVRLTSNNIWCCGKNQPWWEERGLDCSTQARAPGFAKAYSEILPDVVGFQEGDKRLRQTVHSETRKLGLDYSLIYGGLVSLMYRADKLDLIESDFKVYPYELPGYEGSFNNVDSKAYCIGVFRTKEDGKYFIFGSTHLCWQGENILPHSNKARTYQLNMMLDCMDAFREKYNCPAIASGDMNTDYNSEAIQSAIARGYVHAHDIAVEFADERNGHHYCYPEGYDNYENPRPFEKGIDHILVAGLPEGAVRRFERYTPDYYMPLSDHFPVFADIEL